MLTTLGNLLKSIAIDKYIHVLISIVIFAALHTFTGPLIAAGVAVLAHVIKKAVDYANGERDWADLIGDVVAGAIGAGLAWLCLLQIDLAAITSRL